MTDTLNLSHTFGSTKRKGQWQVPEHVVLRQRMGSAELDFTEALLSTTNITLELDMVGGSIELRVPADMHVESTLETTLASYQDHRGANPSPAARTLSIRGRAVWGSVEVRGPKKGR
jgi:hypothetical protein